MLEGSKARNLLEKERKRENLEKMIQVFRSVEKKVKEILSRCYNILKGGIDREHEYHL